MRASGWSIGLVLVVACGPVIPPVPSRGGPAWLEMRSEHFTLWTDASAEHGRELIHDMERRRQMVTTMMNHTTSKARSFVIALRSKREADAYLPRQFIASAWDARNPSREPGILMTADDDERDAVVNHELTHVISFGMIKNQPRWFAEGLATYFETANLNSAETSVELGRPRRDHARLLREESSRSIATLFACEENRCMDGKFYATSWAVFSFLINERFHQLGRYLQRVNDLPSDTPASAELWSEAFPDLPPDRFDKELSGWLASGEVRLPRIKVTIQNVPARERPLGDADVLAARSLLDLQCKGDVAAAHLGAEDALAIDRTNVLARLINTDLTHEISPEDALATATAHPEDWRAWSLVERALKGRPEADAARDRICALTDNDASRCPRAGAPPACRGKLPVASCRRP
jgi:hypothetical protein